jgi:hypothetical protein
MFRDFEAGIYHYNPFNNTLEKIVDGIKDTIFHRLHTNRTMGL